MTIGVDLRALQVGHQYRGIGEVTKQCLNRIFKLAPKDVEHSFIFYEYDDEIDPKTFLDIPEGLNFEEVKLGKRPSAEISRSLGEKLAAKWRSLVGNPIPAVRGCDVFLQFDYALGVPRGTKTVLFAHDIIPFIFWNDYFESAWVPFKNKAARTTLRTIMHNFESKRVLKRSHKNAARIICNSEATRQDIINYLHTNSKKMRVAHLGASLKPVSTGRNNDKAADKLPTKPFLLFVGGIGERRRIDDLVAAYNNLKAAGHDIQLVLVGENFRAPQDIPVPSVRQAILDSSYGDDILTLGYIDDATKQQLYKTALAFVFPTIYEGFGIPILEAMLQGCPVITYKNSSIPEAAGNYAMYAKNWQDIWRQSEALLNMPGSERQKLTDVAKKHAQTFTWEKTANELYRNILGLA